MKSFTPFLPPPSDRVVDMDNPSMDDLKRRPITVLSMWGKEWKLPNKATFRVGSKTYLVPGLLKRPK